METNPLNEIHSGLDEKAIKKLLAKATIFDKIQYSAISKRRIRLKLAELRIRVINRVFMQGYTDEETVFHLFKNWLHPELKHVVGSWHPFLRMHENAQWKFNYTLEDIENWVNENRVYNPGKSARISPPKRSRKSGQRS